MSPKRPARATLVALALALATAGCNAGGTPTRTVPPEGPTPTAVPTTARSSDVPSATLGVTAENVAFAPIALEGPAGVPFAITLRNRDAGIPHNIVIRAGLPANDVAPAGPDLFSGEIFAGPDTRTYALPALPAGVYTFSCAVHPNMVGTLTLK